MTSNREQFLKDLLFLEEKLETRIKEYNRKLQDLIKDLEETRKLIKSTKERIEQEKAPYIQDRPGKKPEKVGKYKI